MKASIKYLFIAGLVIFASCSEKKENPAQLSEILVTVAQPSTQSNTYLFASGKVEAEQNANISTRIMGYVNSIPVNVGDLVKKGQLLLDINSTDIQAQIGQSGAAILEAQAALSNAENDFNRYKNLFKTGSATQKELDNITAQYKMSKARLEAAKQAQNQANVQLSYTRIRAPYSGIITGVFTDEGAITHPGQPLITMENQNAFETIAMIPETEISQIKKGSTVAVEIKSINKSTKGTVTEISTSALHTGGQFLVKVALDKTDFPIYSGMFTTVKFPLEKNLNSDPTLMIPNKAIITKGGLTGVYTISTRNKAVLRWLRLGKVEGSNTEVISGLKAEEAIIISSDAKLYNGAPISIAQ